MTETAAFDSLSKAWNEAKSEHRKWVASHRRDVVDRWEVTLASLTAGHQRLLGEGKWVSGPSSLLSVIGQARRETYHCRVLAWLLDPTGRHGLGIRFIARFLRACFPSEDFDADQLRRASLACEVPRTRSRADIVIWLPTATVVVEAKTDASERPRQCDDLYADFRYDPDPHFVFLSPRGRAPATATGDALEAFHTISLIKCRELLEDALERPTMGTPNETALGSIHNYLATLRREFP